MSYEDVFSEERRRRKLATIDVDEISLVDKAANMKTFAIIKATYPEEVQSLLDQELEKSSEEAQAAVLKALKLLKQYEDDFPSDVLDAVKVLAKYAAAASYGYPEASADEARRYGKSKKGRLEKGGTLWPSLGSKFAAVEDAARDDDGLPERVPERRGVSKAAKGQGDQTIETENLWPSLGS